MRIRWLAESPTIAGTYALASPNVYTTIAEDALQFGTEAECQVWCDQRPGLRGPMWVPRRHGFAEQQRYSTEEEAKAGHARWVERVKADKAPPT